MEILSSYDFKRPSKSRYAPVVKALVKDGAAVVRLKRGEDFDADASIASVQGAVSTQIRENSDRRARTWVEDDDNLIVALWAEGEGPARPRAKRPARKPKGAMVL